MTSRSVGGRAKRKKVHQADYKMLQLSEWSRRPDMGSTFNQILVQFFSQGRHYRSRRKQAMLSSRTESRNPSNPIERSKGKQTKREE